MALVKHESVTEGFAGTPADEVDMQDACISEQALPKNVALLNLPLDLYSMIIDHVR
jgi:hypothetical protein